MKRKSYKGRSLLNDSINKLPLELHLPGYQYCGPGTRLEERLARKEIGINPLDQACREHDIAYHKNKDIESRHKADKILAEKAWQRVKARDSSLGERSSAWLVTNAMKAKTKFGMGRKKKINFRNLVKLAKVKNVSSLIDASRRSYKRALKGLRGQEIPQAPRILPIPKTGGFLPFLIPIMAGLSAIGSLAGGAASVAKAVTEAKDAKRRLDELKRHNLSMEAQKIGEGLFLKPYRKNGYGLFIESKKKKHKYL